MNRRTVFRILIAFLLALALTGCGAQSPVSQKPGDDGVVSIAPAVEINLDLTDFTVDCDTTFQEAQDPDTGKYVIQEVQTDGFASAKGTSHHMFVPAEEPMISQQEDGGYLIEQNVKLNKDNDTIAMLSFAAEFTLDPETGEITGTISLVDREDVHS